METELKNIEIGASFYRKLYYCITVWVRAPEPSIGTEGLLCHELGNSSNSIRIQPNTIVRSSDPIPSNPINKDKEQ